MWPIKNGAQEKNMTDLFDLEQVARQRVSCIIRHTAIAPGNPAEFLSLTTILRLGK